MFQLNKRWTFLKRIEFSIVHFSFSHGQARASIPHMARPEMPKSFLNLIYALVILAVPVFFAALFLTSAARKRKRQRAALDAQLEGLNIPLRNRCEAVLEAVRTSPSSRADASSVE